MILINSSNASKAPSAARPIQTHLYPPNKLNLNMSPAKVNHIVETLNKDKVAIHGSYIIAKLNKGFQRATLI